MEVENQSTVGAPAPKVQSSFGLVSLELIDQDPTFQLRPEGDLSALATDLARLGQLFPVDLRPTSNNRFQVVCGFRRVSALRFLQRKEVMARIHADLSDEDGVLMALAVAIHSEGLSREQLVEAKGRLDRAGRLSVAAKDMLEKALSANGQLAPEGIDEVEEVDADELASAVTQRLGEINQDLSLLADVFASLEPNQQEELLTQLRYSADLVAYLEGTDDQ
jgi:ParB family transcriptional regulator, chromosome partitioning protein